jgi:hypothetical protein
MFVGITPKKLMLRRDSIRTLPAIEMGAIRGGNPNSGVTTEAGGSETKHVRTR